MLAIERRNEILMKLQAERRVVVSELSQLYDVSEETIRRDLEKLVNEGVAIKSYGGAVINENANLEVPFNIRKNYNVIGKQKIAEQIAAMVKDGESLMLDASSTAVYIAKEKKKKKNLTVIREGSFALVGPQTDKMLKSYHVDKAVISCKGFDLESGITDSDELHANNKITMLGAAGKKILAVDKSKFDKTAFTAIGALDDITTVVTDEEPDRRWLQAFEEAGIECVYPR